MHKVLVTTTPTRHGLGTGSCFEWFEQSCPSLEGQLSFHYVTPKDTVNLKSYDRHIVLGFDAFKACFPTRSLDKDRGSYLPSPIPTTATFHPQDADDFKGDDSDDDDSNEKDKSSTRPGNYRFWIRSDLRKLLLYPYTPPKPEVIRLAPNLHKAIEYLRSCKQFLYLDIECRRGDQSLNCIGFACDDGPVYVIPIYDFKHKLFYSNAALFLRQLCLTMVSATVVIHNSLFDLWVLCHNYRLPVGRKIYDTMLAHHRCFPEVEKSLGHVISYWTWLPFHKDENVEHPRNDSQQFQLWNYNAKDVSSMRAVHKAQLEYIAGNPGLTASVNQANDSIYPYLLTMLNGIAYDNLKLIREKLSHMRYLSQVSRIARILSGDGSFNPNSTDQAIKYFHTKLGYAVQGRTDTGRPALGQTELLKLRLHYPNPLIDVIIRYRLTQKELSMLEFIPIE